MIFVFYVLRNEKVCVRALVVFVIVALHACVTCAYMHAHCTAIVNVLYTRLWVYISTIYSMPL